MKILKWLLWILFAIIVIEELAADLYFTVFICLVLCVAAFMGLIIYKLNLF